MIALRENLPSDFVSRVSDIFAPGGLLSKAQSYEYRPEQQQMAVAVAQALEDGAHQVVEAGTGVGKSLAYLVPAVLFAIENKRKALISTHTINLQEQLIYKDIPIVQKVLPVEFEAALWKGRQNYLCATRLERASPTRRSSHHAGDRRAAAHPRVEPLDEGGDAERFLRGARFPGLVAGVQRAASLHRQDVRGQPALLLPAGAQALCQCRRSGAQSHRLLRQPGALGDREEDSTGYLFANDFVVFDEAHTLEGVASRHIGLSVSQYGLRHAPAAGLQSAFEKGLFTVLRNAMGCGRSRRCWRTWRLSSRNRGEGRFPQRARVPGAPAGFCQRHADGETCALAGHDRHDAARAGG